MLRFAVCYLCYFLHFLYLEFYCILSRCVEGIVLHIQVDIFFTKAVLCVIQFLTFFSLAHRSNKNNIVNTVEIASA